VIPLLALELLDRSVMDLGHSVRRWRSEVLKAHLTEEGDLLAVVNGVDVLRALALPIDNDPRRALAASHGHHLSRCTSNVHDVQGATVGRVDGVESVAQGGDSTRQVAVLLFDCVVLG